MPRALLESCQKGLKVRSRTWSLFESQLRLVPIQKSALTLSFNFKPTQRNPPRHHNKILLQRLRALPSYIQKLQGLRKDRQTKRIHHLRVRIFPRKRAWHRLHENFILSKLLGRGLYSSLESQGQINCLSQI